MPAEEAGRIEHQGSGNEGCIQGGKLVILQEAQQRYVDPCYGKSGLLFCLFDGSFEPFGRQTQLATRTIISWFFKPGYGVVNLYATFRAGYLDDFCFNHNFPL